MVTEADDEKWIKIEDGIPTRRIDWVRSPSRPTDISDKKKTNAKKYSTAMHLDESDIRRYHTSR